MGIGKSRGTSPINVNDMLEKVEINQQIETEKSEVDKLLVEIREAKETLIKFNEDLEKAIAAESHIEGKLKAAVSSCDNIVNCICNAIVKAELKWIEVALLQEYLFGCLSSKRRRGKGKNAEGHPALNRNAPGRRLKKSATVIERWRAI